MSETRTVLALVVVATLLLAGCTGGPAGRDTTAGGGATTTTSPATTTTTAAAPDADAIRNDAVSAIESVETYRVAIDQTARIGGNVEQVVETEMTAVYDRTEQEYRQNQTSTAMGRTQTVTRYLVGETMYAKSEAFVRSHSSKWVKVNFSESLEATNGNFSTVWKWSDKLGRQREVLRVADVEYAGTETVDGTETYVLDAEVSEDQYQELLDGLVGGALPRNTSSLYTVHGMSFRYWIDQETHRPVKTTGRMNITVTTGGQELSQNMTFTTRFSGYGSSVDVELPDGAENAVPLFDRGESGEGSDGDAGPTPSAAFDFEYDSGEGTLTVAHSGGDTFTAENTGSLAVTVDGERRTEWSLPVSAGDSVSVDVSGGETVRVRWTAPGSNRSVTVGEFEVPDDDDG